MEEIIDISNIGDNTSLKMDSGGLLSSNFGPGIELLMNDKKPSSRDHGGSGGINFDDLTNLEAELNDAADMGGQSSILDASDITDNIKIEKENFSGVNDINIEPLNVKFDSNEDSKLGFETLNSGGNNKTWDGYSKFNEIPVDPSSRSHGNSSTANMPKEEILKEKFNYLKKLEGLERKGVELTKRYSMESSLQEMMGEYEMSRQYVIRSY